MRIDACVAGGSRQVLVLTVWDVKVGLGIPILLRQAKINNVDLISTLANPHQEVVRLDVTVDERLGMDVFNARDELVGQQQHRLQGEFAIAKIEKILQAGPKKVKDHGVVITFRPKPAYKRNTNASCQGLVDAGLIFELRMLGFDALQLDGNLFARDNIGTCRAG